MNYVIVGNGVAGTTAAASIRKLDAGGRITLITSESYPFYSRVRLIEFLADEVDEKGLQIRKDTWYDENRIDLVLNALVTGIDHARRSVITSRGDAFPYDRLLLATGGVSFVPPIPGADKQGVFTLRTLGDAIRIKEYLQGGGRRVTLVGGGVLGLEAGNSLRKKGNQVTVVEFFPRLLPRQMDAEGAEILKRQLESMGFVFRLGARSKEITGGERAEALILDDGTSIACDMILLSAGIRPATALADTLGLVIKKGLVVNDRMETSTPGIYGAGDVIEHNSVCYGIWPAAEKQGLVAGTNMAGGGAVYEGTAMSNLLKVAGVDLFSAGETDAEGKLESLVSKDEGKFTYKKLVIQDNRIAGAILYGDIKDRRKILKAIESKTDISPLRKELQDWNLSGL